MAKEFFNLVKNLFGNEIFNRETGDVGTLRMRRLRSKTMVVMLCEDWTSEESFRSRVLRFAA